MRHVAACLASFALGLVPGFAASNAAPEAVTIVFHFEGPYSEKSLGEMKHELRGILDGSGLDVQWRERRAVGIAESFSNLIVVSFHGLCQMNPSGDFHDGGPLAITYRDGKTVLPFSEIECDQVRSSLRHVMWGADYKRSDLLFGRALARVLAHELYHVLAKTATHASRGIARPSLSGAELISDELHLNDRELNRMQETAEDHLQ